MKNDNQPSKHFIEDICDCLIEAFCRVTLDEGLNRETIRTVLEQQIRSHQNLSPWMKELIRLEDERMTKH